MRIETERLVIRSLCPVDAAPLAALWADPSVTAHLGGPRDEGEIRRVLEQDALSREQDRENDRMEPRRDGPSPSIPGDGRADSGGTPSQARRLTLDG